MWVNASEPRYNFYHPGAPTGIFQENEDRPMAAGVLMMRGVQNVRSGDPGLFMVEKR